MSPRSALTLVMLSAIAVPSHADAGVRQDAPQQTLEDARQAAAQPATFYGTVYDETGRTVPGAKVILVTPSSQATITVDTDSAGYFQLRDVAAGTYTVDATFHGFETLRSEVTLGSGQSVSHDLTLELGTIRETVTVVEGAQERALAADGAGMNQQRGVNDLRGRLATDGCRAEPAGGCVRPPLALIHETPRYPASLQGSGLAGIVVVRGRISLDGFLIGLQATDVGRPEFAQAALDALNQWQFEPTRLNGEVVETNIEISLSFTTR